jgi:hypothetical protein
VQLSHSQVAFMEHSSNFNHSGQATISFATISHKPVVQRYHSSLHSCCQKPYHHNSTSFNPEDSLRMVCGWNESDDRVEALVAWKKSADADLNKLKTWKEENFLPWKAGTDSEVKDLKSWKEKEFTRWKTTTDDALNKLKKWKSDEFVDWQSRTDAELKNLASAQKISLCWQQALDKWKTTTDTRLGELDKNKMGVEDYRKERNERDKRLGDIQNLLTSAIPDMRDRTEAVESKVAKLEKKANLIDETVHKLKQTKTGDPDFGGNGNSVNINAHGLDACGNIYMIQQQGQQSIRTISLDELNNSPFNSPAPICRYPIYCTPYNRGGSRRHRDEDEDEASFYNQQQMPNIRLGFSRTTPGGLFKKGKKHRCEFLLGGGHGAMRNGRRTRRSEYGY